MSGSQGRRSDDAPKPSRLCWTGFSGPRFRLGGLHCRLHPALSSKGGITVSTSALAPKPPALALPLPWPCSVKDAHSGLAGLHGGEQRRQTQGALGYLSPV